MSIRVLRSALAGAGALVAAYGVWLLVRWQSLGQVTQVIEWAAAGVVLHDAVIAPLSLAVGWLVGRWLPRRIGAAVAVVGIVAGSTTVAAFAVLGRSGADSANHTLLDRDYHHGWLFVVGGVVAITTAGAGLRWLLQTTARTPERRVKRGTRHGRR